MTPLYLIAGLILFGLLYLQTGQGPLEACLWLLLRLRAMVILTAWTAQHVAWWVPAHWREALVKALKEIREKVSGDLGTAAVMSDVADMVTEGLEKAGVPE